MQSSDRNAAAAALADPSPAPERLAEIAAQCPELRPQVSDHPNIYPGLLERMGEAVGEKPQPEVPQQHVLTAATIQLSAA
ncbi:hypothetical protein [Leucobacter ruminantium]|uniref:Leucine rich repeat variant domain-containing protein n=1 Tax=Leucobacter ruminantium TaxID=1289170 RepID=A0A939LZJ5_9MICO|nr:hypothetical protein [Leucobacter ruminantium]MBO1804345.1 hypothetical protein [Leucobacter ruminantium]